MVVTVETSSVFLRSRENFQKDCFFKGWIDEIRHKCWVIICGVDVQLNISWHVMRKKMEKLNGTLAAPATLINLKLCWCYYDNEVYFDVVLLWMSCYM